MTGTGEETGKPLDPRPRIRISVIRDERTFRIRVEVVVDERDAEGGVTQVLVRGEPKDVLDVTIVNGVNHTELSRRGVSFPNGWTEVRTKPGSAAPFTVQVTFGALRADFVLMSDGSVQSIPPRTSWTERTESPKAFRSPPPRSLPPPAIGGPISPFSLPIPAAYLTRGTPRSRQPHSQRSGGGGSRR